MIFIMNKIAKSLYKDFCQWIFTKILGARRFFSARTMIFLLVDFTKLYLFGQRFFKRTKIFSQIIYFPKIICTCNVALR